MKVRVRGVEIECESLDELDAIIDRYGEGAPVRGANGLAGLSVPTVGATNVDQALLRAFLNAPSGLPSQAVQGMLHVKGKAIPGALKAWAVRVHLPDDGFEKANPGGKRGWRLSDAGAGAARVLNVQT